MRSKKALLVEQKIMEFCKDERRKLSQIGIFLNMNIHTLRTVYLYKMVKEGKLRRIEKTGYETVEKTNN